MVEFSFSLFTLWKFSGLLTTSTPSSEFSVVTGERTFSSAGDTMQVHTGTNSLTSNPMITDLMVYM